MCIFIAGGDNSETVSNSLLQHFLEKENKKIGMLQELLRVPIF